MSNDLQSYSISIKFTPQVVDVPDDEVDRICRESIADGLPICPWMGTTAFPEHLERKQTAIMAKLVKAFR